VPLPARGRVVDDEGDGCHEEDYQVDEEELLPAERAPGQRGWIDQEPEEQRERVGDVPAKMDHGLLLHGEPPGAAQQFRQELARRLNPSLGPPPLLDFEGAGVVRQLRGNPDVLEEDEAPSVHLCPVADVEVLGEGVRLPSARVLEAFAAPHAAGAVEVEEEAAPVASSVLEEEVPVEEEALGAGEPVGVFVEMIPAGLHHPDAGLLERGQQLPDQIRLGHEVRVQHQQELAVGTAHARGQGARLEARALPAADVAHVDAPGPPPRHPPGDEVHGFVGGVVQHLDLEGAGRIVERARGVDHPPGDGGLIVQG